MIACATGLSAWNVAEERASEVAEAIGSIEAALDLADALMEEFCELVGGVRVEGNALYVRLPKGATWRTMERVQSFVGVNCDPDFNGPGGSTILRFEVSE